MENYCSGDQIGCRRPEQERRVGRDLLCFPRGVVQRKRLTSSVAASRTPGLHGALSGTTSKQVFFARGSSTVRARPQSHFSLQEVHEKFERGVEPEKSSSDSSPSSSSSASSSPLPAPAFAYGLYLFNFISRQLWSRRSTKRKKATSHSSAYAGGNFTGNRRHRADPFCPSPRLLAEKPAETEASSARVIR